MENNNSSIQKFLKSYARKNGYKNTHNIYHIQSINKSGDVTNEAFCANLITNVGMDALVPGDGYMADSEFYNRLFIGTGSTTPQVTDTNLTNIGYPYAAQMESRVKIEPDLPGSLPLEYDSDTGYITESVQIANYYFDYELYNTTSDIVISEIGFGEGQQTSSSYPATASYSYVQNSLRTHSLIYDSDGEITTITKHDTEKLIITVYLCISIDEDMILDALDTSEGSPCYMLLTPIIYDPFVTRGMYEEYPGWIRYLTGSQSAVCSSNGSSYFFTIAEFNRQLSTPRDNLIHRRFEYTTRHIALTASRAFYYNKATSEGTGKKISSYEYTSSAIITNPEVGIAFDIQAFGPTGGSTGGSDIMYGEDRLCGYQKGMTSMIFRLPKLETAEELTVYAFVDLFYENNPSFRRQISLPLCSQIPLSSVRGITSVISGSLNHSSVNPLYKEISFCRSDYNLGMYRYNGCFGFGNMNMVNDIDIEDVYMYNYLTDDFDIPINSHSDDYDYTESFNIHAALPLSINNNIGGGNNYKAPTFVNSDMETPIIGFNTTSSGFKLYAADKYWDPSTYQEIEDIHNVSSSLQKKRYYMTDKSVGLLSPIRGGIDTHHYTIPTNQAYAVDIDENEICSPRRNPNKTNNRPDYLEHIPHSIKKNWAVVNNTVVYFDSTHGGDDAIRTLPEQFDTSSITPVNSSYGVIKFIDKKNTRIVSEGGTMMVQEFIKLNSGKTSYNLNTDVHLTFAVFDMTDFESGSTTNTVYDVDLSTTSPKDGASSYIGDSYNVEYLSDVLLVGSYYDDTTETDYLFIGERQSNSIIYKIISKTEGSAPVISDLKTISGVDSNSLTPIFGKNSQYLYYMPNTNNHMINAVNILDDTEEISQFDFTNYTLTSSKMIAWKQKCAISVRDNNSIKSLLTFEVSSESPIVIGDLNVLFNGTQYDIQLPNIYPLYNYHLMISASENYLIFIGLIPSPYDRYIDCAILWNYENNTFTKLPIYSDGGEENYKWDGRVICQPDIVESPDGKHILAILNPASKGMYGSIVLDVGYCLNRNKLYPLDYYNGEGQYIGTTQGDYFQSYMQTAPWARMGVSASVFVNDGVFTLRRPGVNDSPLGCYWSPYENNLMLSITGTTKTISAYNNPKKITEYSTRYKVKNIIG